MPSNAGFVNVVKKPAWPIMDFSISALQGHTVTQWPHETQLDSPIAEPPSHSTRGVRVLPANRQRLVHLNVLARLDAAATENALVRIVAIKGIRSVHWIRLWPERDFLMFYGQEFCRVVDRAIPVVVVANRAVEHVVAENPVKRLPLRGVGSGRFR